MIFMGNVVRWLGDLYIVKDSNYDFTQSPPVLMGLVLMPFNYSNTESHPTLLWPTRRVYECDCETHDRHCRFKEEPDPAKTVDTVEYVADTVQELIMGRLKELLLS